MKKTVLLLATLFFLNLIGYTQMSGYNGAFGVGSTSKVNFGQLMGYGMPFRLENNSNVKGNPYLVNEFSDCFVKLKDDKVYEGIKIKFNLASNKVHFLNDKNEELVANDGVIKRFFIKKPGNTDIIEFTFGNGYPEVPGKTIFTYYQEYNDGQVKLLRYVFKSLISRGTLATVDPTREYDLKDEYYLYNAELNKMIKWRKGKEFILDFLADKSNEINQFINSSNISCKTKNDILRVLEFYNNLKK